MRRKLRTLLLSLVAVAVLAFVALIAFTMGKPTPMLPLPNPNGYQDFVKAGEMLSGDRQDFVELPDMSEDELRTAFATKTFAKHGEALALARLGLGRESRVPLDYSATSAAHLSDLSAIKQIAFAFMAEGRLAEMENRSVDAAQSYLELIRLGHDAARGGTMLDSMNGRTVEALGLVHLEKLTLKLDARSCREMATALETIDERSESPEAILRQEKDWARRTYGFKGQITRLFTYQSLKQSEQKMAGKMKGQKIRRQSLMVKLAVRAYEQETGLPLKTLADVAPGYLKTVPQDLLIGTNLLTSP